MNRCRPYEPQHAPESDDAFRTDTCDMQVCSAVGQAVSFASGLAAICVRRNNVDSMYYVYPDRLGSYTHITNSGKQIVRDIHFDPWGNVKADTNWSVFAERELGELESTFRFDRGFTGHEHYTDLKIINMNGRLYDPVIARFFSPDNFVQAPEFTQSYNRYSYCLNNPLQYTDPSGESFLADFLYGICNIFTMPARITTESVSWLNDHINGNVKVDGYFHSDYIFNSAPPHYINYNNVINLQNPFLYSFHEPDQMTDADGTTYRIEYFWAAVGAGGNYNLTFANQNFSGVFGHYHETVRWYTREVPIENNSTRELNLQPLFMFNSNLKVSLNSFAVGNGAKCNLIDAGARYYFPDHKNWFQFKMMDEMDRALLYNKALGKTVTNYLKVASKANGVAGIISVSTDLYNAYAYHETGGHDWQVYTKIGMDMLMTGVSFLGPVGFAISTTYFILDVSTGGFGGFGKIY